MSIIPLVIMGGLLVVLMFVSSRNKSKRAAADVARRDAMTVGTRVMTTSGMHATIVSVNPDNDGTPADTVVLEIAPGVEVEWALAAVREAPTRVVAADTPDTPEAIGASEAIGAVGASDTAAASAASATSDTAGGPVRLAKPKPKGRTADH